MFHSTCVRLFISQVKALHVQHQGYHPVALEGLPEKNNFPVKIMQDAGLLRVDGKKVATRGKGVSRGQVAQQKSCEEGKAVHVASSLFSCFL